MMSEASTGLDAERRLLTLAGWGFMGETVEPTGMFPTDKLVVLEVENPNSFSLARC